MHADLSSPRLSGLCLCGVGECVWVCRSRQSRRGSDAGQQLFGGNFVCGGADHRRAGDERAEHPPSVAPGDGAAPPGFALRQFYGRHALGGVRDLAGGGAEQIHAAGAALGHDEQVPEHAGGLVFHQLQGRSALCVSDHGMGGVRAFALYSLLHGGGALSPASTCARRSVCGIERERRCRSFRF